MQGRLLLITWLAMAGVAQAAPHEHGVPAAEGRAKPVAWSALPLLLPVGGRGGERDGAQLRPVGIAASELLVFAPDGSQKSYPVDAEGARIRSAAPTLGNYHWVLAREETPTHVGIASTTWYFSNPGPAPAKLLARQKAELEITPSPLPREHGSYRESEKWRFAVLFMGQPLAGKSLRMETEGGSRSVVQTDQNGIATVLFPRDFAASKGGGHGRPKMNFVLAVEHEAGGKHYRTTFNHTYTPDADRNRSLAWGGAFLLAGMLGAAPLLRRRAANNQRPEA